MHLRIRTHADEGFSLLEIVAIAFYILVEINVELFVHRPLYIAAVSFLLIAFGISKGIRLRALSYLVWIMLWAGMTAFSLLYSIQISYTATALLTILARGIAIYLIITRIETKEELIYLLKIFINIATINLLYVLTKVDVTTLGISRIGVRTIESDVSWNSNSIGTILALASASIIILLYHQKYKRPRRIVALLQLTIFAIVTLLCGSRISLLLLVGIPLSVYLFSSNIKTAGRNIVIIVLVLIMVYWLMMNVPAFYAVLGSRVERLILTIRGQSVTDGSINSRIMLIEYGMQWFRERPLFGHGMYTFMALSSSYFSYAWYAHNNYIEILVGTGIVGLIIYYWYYLRIIIKAIRLKLDERRMIVPIMMVMLIGEYGVVAFKSFAFQFMLGVVTILFNLGVRNKIMHNREE